MSSADKQHKQHATEPSAPPIEQCCSICLRQLSDVQADSGRDTAVICPEVILECRHRFHVPCYERIAGHTCPECRFVSHVVACTTDSAEHVTQHQLHDMSEKLKEQTVAIAILSAAVRRQTWANSRWLIVCAGLAGAVIGSRWTVTINPTT